MSKELSERLGESLAHLQDLTDTIAHSVIRRIRNSKKGDRIANRTIQFFSELGDSYYRKYSEIKGRKNK
ncbi:MAG: hypothetical protein KAK01_04805 [Candidatus Marinimicrobia bacterium]|nr:hypothetical protein [Candidatus Neomarinimicrobiota bacterium]